MATGFVETVITVGFFLFSSSSLGQKSQSATAAITSIMTITSGQFRFLSENDDTACAVTGTAFAGFASALSPEGCIAASGEVGEMPVPALSSGVMAPSD